MTKISSPIESMTASAESPKLGEIAGKADDPVLWLGTVTSQGRPSIRPVWFVLHEGKFVIFSTPNAWKVRHVQANPDVCITFHTDPAAKNLLVVAGRAEVSLEGHPPSSIPAYGVKYASGFADYNYSQQRFDELYPTRITVTPERAWGW